jgi:fatty-acid desaturase
MMALPAAPPLHPKRGIAVVPLRLKRRWGTSMFMVLIHGLAPLAMLPRFWSGPALAVLLLLYWLSACAGVTLAYRWLLAHRAFQVPRWLAQPQPPVAAAPSPGGCAARHRSCHSCGREDGTTTIMPPPAAPA